MIRIVLLGRTGNHMFQYALGRVLAEKWAVPLVLDASWFNAQGWSEVSHFLRLPLQATVVRRCSLGSRALRNITGKHYWEYRGIPTLREPNDNQSFDRRFLSAPGNCLLFGYFQSFLYFETIAPSLRHELNSLLAEAVRVPENLRADLSSANSVAVHVRRNDYLNLPIFQVCDMDYYRASMQQMRDRIPGARFFVFSDDPEWCRGEFRAADQEVIDQPLTASNPIHDLHLMSLTYHHIIANSSYSWWAAWLGEKPGQQVFLPDRWYAHSIKAPIGEKMPRHWSVVIKHR